MDMKLTIDEALENLSATERALESALAARKIASDAAEEAKRAHAEATIVWMRLRPLPERLVFALRSLSVGVQRFDVFDDLVALHEDAAYALSHLGFAHRERHAQYAVYTITESGREKLASL